MGVARVQGDASNRVGALVVKKGFKGQSVVGSFPYSTRGSSDVPFVGVKGVDCEVCDAAACEGGSDGTKGESVKFLSDERCGQSKQHCHPNNMFHSPKIHQVAAPGETALESSPVGGRNSLVQRGQKPIPAAAGRLDASTALNQVVGQV